MKHPLILPHRMRVHADSIHGRIRHQWFIIPLFPHEKISGHTPPRRGGRGHPPPVIPRRRTHVVKAGETGFSIAMDYGVPWSVIAAANGVAPDAPVVAGTRLAIPIISAARAEAVPQPPAPAQEAAPLADTPPPRFAWPLRGKIRRAFLTEQVKDGPHEGIDILSPLGTAVRASAAGKVIFAGSGPDAYGLTVILFHGGRWTTTYSFLQKVTVKEGDEVKAGERIGLVGDTGLAREPQLHFEVRRNRVPLDPAKFLTQQVKN